MSLNNKRKKIKDMLFDYANPIGIFMEIEKQDKEAVEELKEELIKQAKLGTTIRFSHIDKIFGDFK